MHLTLTGKEADGVGVTGPWENALGQSRVQEGKPWALSEHCLTGGPQREGPHSLLGGSVGD